MEVIHSVEARDVMASTGHGLENEQKDDSTGMHVMTWQIIDLIATDKS